MSDGEYKQEPGASGIDVDAWNHLLSGAIEEALTELCALQDELAKLGPEMRHLQQRGALILKFVFAAKALVEPATITEADLAWAREEARRLGIVWKHPG